MSKLLEPRDEEGNMITPFSQEPYDKDGLPLEVFLTAAIYCYEVGDIMKSLLYSMRRKDLSKAYLAEATIALSDSITMSRLLAQQLGDDFETLVEIGEERYLERIAEVKNWARQ